MPDIPEFLVRAPDGAFLHPRPRSTEGFKWSAPDAAPLISLAEQSDAELFSMAESTGISLVDRQPVYMELRRREDRKKSLARIAEMKDKKAAKET
jgi:hypothetical protein